VLELPVDQIKAAPEISAAIDARHVTGLGKIGDRILILIDIHGMVTSPEFGLAE
jgi:purine-binding chemotaxis protein CheW